MYVIGFVFGLFVGILICIVSAGILFSAELFSDEYDWDNHGWR
jgi:uncharacterized membrane protein required for colicin V production